MAHACVCRFIGRLVLVGLRPRCHRVMTNTCGVWPGFSLATTTRSCPTCGSTFVQCRIEVVTARVASVVCALNHATMCAASYRFHWHATTNNPTHVRTRWVRTTATDEACSPFRSIAGITIYVAGAAGANASCTLTRERCPSTVAQRRKPSCCSAVIIHRYSHGA